MPRLRFTSILLLAAIAVAQPPVPGGGRAGGRGGPQVVSPQIESDGGVTLRIYAPNASAVSFTGDLSLDLVPETLGPASSTETPATAMTKGADGVWAVTKTRRMKPGAWRHLFNVDGATTVDSRNVNVSPTQTQMQSVLYVAGDFSETRDVPHGAVSSVRYVAATLGNARREAKADFIHASQQVEESLFR
jgi:hypothetical protein